MRLYLVQHGEAVDERVDPERPLSEAGAAAVDRVARFLEPAGLNLPAVWHSGKLRARQTADRLAPRLAPQGEVIEAADLKPSDPVVRMAGRLRAQEGDLLIVGHLPHLGKLASLLLSGSEDAAVVQFQQGGVVALELDDAARWHLLWMVVPELLAP